MQQEPLSQEEVKPLESSPVQETTTKPKRNITVIVLSLFLIILCMTVAGVGFWAYKLNSSLTTTKQQLVTLQSDHAKLESDNAQLKSDNEKLTSDLTKSKADFEKTDGDLTTAQADLKKSQGQNKGLQDKIALAGKKAEILAIFSNIQSAADILRIDTLVKATNDQELLTHWNDFTESPSLESTSDFLLYIISSVRDELK